MARPLVKIDPDQVLNLSAIGCTTAEIAAVMDCCPDTLERRFSGIMKKGRDRMRMSIRRIQLQQANAGSAAMAIWLGKQYLNQKDKAEIEYRDLDAAIERELETLTARGETAASRETSSGELIN